MEKVCSRCKRLLPLTSYTKAYGKYQRSYCRDCSNKYSRQYGQENRSRRNERLKKWRKANPELAKKLDFRRRLWQYKLTPEQLDTLKRAQANRCLICGRDSQLLAIDHNHSTGEVRGLLCRYCNTLVGYVEARPHILDNLYRYLERSRNSSKMST